MARLTLGSLASGIGGLDLAVEAVFGAHTIWHAEKDKYANEVYESHWDNPNLSDITKIDWSTVEKPDIICGGYPCQPYSQAGKRKGADDERDLWPHFANAIRILRPTIVVLENVSAHLSLGFDRVLGDLAEVGYDAVWELFRASDVGAPHRRERVFIIAYSDKIGRKCFNPIERNQHQFDGTGKTFRNANRKRLQESWDNRQGRLDWGHFEPAIRRWERIMNEEAPTPLDGKRLNPEFVRWVMGFRPGWTFGSQTQQLKMLGNAVVPQQAELAIRTLVKQANRSVYHKVGA